MTRRHRFWISLVAMAAAVGVYLIGAVHSPMFDGNLEARQHYRQANLKASASDTDREQTLARTYWQMNPDVRADPYYGEGGKMGIFGAREHHRQHGKREGRAWSALPGE